MSVDLGYVETIREAAQALVEHVSGHSQVSFQGDRKTRSAVLYEIVIIGEGVKRLSVGFRARHPEVAWKCIAGMRDRIVHSFDEVDLPLVWDVARSHAPQLILDLGQIEAQGEGAKPLMARPSHPPGSAPCSLATRHSPVATHHSPLTACHSPPVSRHSCPASVPWPGSNWVRSSYAIAPRFVINPIPTITNTRANWLRSRAFL